MRELWKDVVDYEGEYMISDKGRVMSLKSKSEPRILTTFLGERGYPRINLLRNGKNKQVFVHRLVVESFIGSIPEGKFVNHKDGDKTNNNLHNLEIVTQKENVQHSLYVLGNGVKPVYKLNKNNYRVICEYKNVSQASKETGICDAAIWKVCNEERNFAGGYSWAYKENYSNEYIEAKRKRYKKGLRMKRVYQIDPKTNEVIREFEGVRAAERELGIFSIKHCLAGITKSAGGYRWSYEIPVTEIV